GEAARNRRQAEADLHPGCGVGRGGECGAEVLGRDRGGKRTARQGRLDLQGVQPDPEEGRRRLHAGLTRTATTRRPRGRRATSTSNNRTGACGCRSTSSKGPGTPGKSVLWPEISHSIS